MAKTLDDPLPSMKEAMPRARQASVSTQNPEFKKRIAEAIENIKTSLTMTDEEKRAAHEKLAKETLAEYKRLRDLDVTRSN